MTTFTNSKLTDEYVSNATLIRLILWADQHNSHYVVAALRELQERRKADSVPVEINDDMAYAFHHALSDSSLGADEVEEIKTGLRAAFANVAVQPALIVPAEIEPDDSNTFDYVDGWNACRATMLQSQREGNPHVTPARLPGGFTIEDAKELHEDLVRSHISKTLSGEKMKKKDRDADLRWIHGVIVQAAWFVKASLDALPEPLREEKGGSANCTASHGTTDNPPVPGKQTDELTMLVKQLVSQLKKVKPDYKLPDKAMDYLKRNELISAEDVLR
ncbi:hypothetical protein HA998_003331 [Escherichia coli]|nr:hypothetical protein [Escherichia coli]